MSFAQRLKIVENLLNQDTEGCLMMISQRFFIHSLFYQELKALINMFEGYLQKKTAGSKQNNDDKSILRDQLILGFYSIIIMRSTVISMRHEQISTIATKAEQFSETMFNSKLAVQNLTKIYRKLEEGDQSREIIAGLLLQIKGFNNYKMIVKDLNPRFVSEQTMQTHFQSIKTQCPNLLQTQLNKYKVKWGKYLRFKPLSLESLVKLIERATELQSVHDVEKWDEWKKQLQNESGYILSRLSLLNSGEMVEKINIDELVKHVDEVNLKLNQKLKETAITTRKNAKTDILSGEYDMKQFILKNYLSFYLTFLKIINTMISTIGKNWLRKIKWLYNLVNSIFVNFNIKSSHFHQSIAQEYSQIMIILVKMLTNFLVTFGTGLYSAQNLNNLAINQEYSIYKLVQALLYNEYPFEEAQVIQFQNYQKQRNHHQNKSKQAVIDLVNFNMKSLNINLHWDTFFMKIIPNLKNSVGFAQQIIYLSLYYMFKYFELTQNYQPAAKFLLMISNAKNATLVAQNKNRRLIEQIKASVYPHKKEMKEGIEYYCQEYFAEYMKINKKRVQEEERRKVKADSFTICRNEELKLNDNVGHGFKKTESRENILEGWDNYQSEKENTLMNNQQSKKQNTNQNPQMFNSELFYSVKDSVIEGSIKQNNKAEQIDCEQNEILLPQF